MMSLVCWSAPPTLTDFVMMLIVALSSSSSRLAAETQGWALGAPPSIYLSVQYWCARLIRPVLTLWVVIPGGVMWPTKAGARGFLSQFSCVCYESQVMVEGDWKGKQPCWCEMQRWLDWHEWRGSRMPEFTVQSPMWDQLDLIKHRGHQVVS